MASMQEQLISLLKTEYAVVPFGEILRKPVTALLGVGEEAAAALKILDIHTVFDLATSEVFAAASKILDAGQSTKSLIYQYGAPSADLVRESASSTAGIGQLKNSSISALQRVPNDKGDAISRALGVTNIRELALYPPHEAAVKILNRVYFPENDPAVDSEQPVDLLPKNGEYPTEKVQYTTLVMDEIGIDEGGIDIASSDFKPLDLVKLALEDTGFQKIAYGALITMTQSWFAQGVTLGHLLHSVSLAPGESTRIAMVDWTRKSRAGQTEVLTEEDELDNQTAHNRAMNEVTAATARDAQTGFSQSNQSSSAEAAAVAASASASFLGAASVDVSAGYSMSNSNASADSYSTSSGSRDISSQMAQNVNDRTHQNAHSTRSRRAAVVKEVSQSEHEAISTRILANYNHMHALTVQYYEVVQIYKTRVSISKVDKVLFIPVKLLDFDNDDLISRFRAVLSMASPTREISRAIQNLDSVELAPAPKTVFSGLKIPVNFEDVKIIGRTYDMGKQGPLIGILTGTRTNPPLGRTIARDPDQPEGGASGSGGRSDPLIAAIAPSLSRGARPTAFSKDVRAALWDTNEPIQEAGRTFSYPIFQNGSESLFLPNDVLVEGIEIDGEGENTMTPVFGLAAGGTTNVVSTNQPIPLAQLTYIGVKGSLQYASTNVTVQISTVRNGLRAPINLPVVTIGPGFGGTTEVVRIKAGKVKPEIKAFLKANRAFYSLAVFRSLTPTQIALLLSGYTVKIKERRPGPAPESPETVEEHSVPVSQVVEPRPIRYVGNFLCFAMNTAAGDPDWTQWLQKRGLKVGYATEDIVPLPSGGTFAEAVLGRYNCAEKLDMTRFWNWQDSPIPILPSDIAAIQAGNHNTSDGGNVQPGQLSQPIINMAAPAPLPDPAGTTAVLAAIQNGAMFRDMAGLALTQQLAQAGTAATAQAATSAGQQAGANLQATMAQNTERQRIEAQSKLALAQMAMSMPSASKGGLNHSQDGAKVNYFDSQAKLGASGLTGSPGDATRGVGAGISPGPTSGLIRGSGGGTGAPSAGSAASLNPAFNAAVWGDGAPRSALLQRALDMTSADGPQPPAFENIAYTGDPAQVKGWEDLLEFQVPDVVVNAMAARDIKVQKFDDALGDLTVDLFEVRISKLPVLPGETAPATAEDFLFYMRTHLNDDRFIDTGVADFYVLDAAMDKATWESRNPVGAVIGINIPFWKSLKMSAMDTPLGTVELKSIGDNAAVVCSGADGAHWRFTTVTTPFRQTGTHPVTGSRDFGIKPLPSNSSSGGSSEEGSQAAAWTFYTRGSSRPTGPFETILQNITFSGERKLWTSLQERTAKFINTHSGAAEAVVPPLQRVVKWPGSVWNTLEKGLKGKQFL